MSVYEAEGLWERQGEGILAEWVFVFDGSDVLRSGDTLVLPYPPPLTEAMIRAEFWRIEVDGGAAADGPDI